MEQHYKLYRIREIADGDEDFIKTLVETFVEEIPADAKILHQAVLNNNYLTSYQTAHKMKPTIDMFELGVLPELIAVQDWGKYNKTELNILPTLQIVLDAIKQTVIEIRSDFNL